MCVYLRTKFTHHPPTAKSTPKKPTQIRVKLNHKISIVFHNLKNYDSRLIMQELRKFDFKRNIQSGL